MLYENHPNVVIYQPYIKLGPLETLVHTISCFKTTEALIYLYALAQKTFTIITGSPKWYALVTSINPRNALLA